MTNSELQSIYNLNHPLVDEFKTKIQHSWFKQDQFNKTHSYTESELYQATIEFIVTLYSFKKSFDSKTFGSIRHIKIGETFQARELWRGEILGKLLIKRMSTQDYSIMLNPNLFRRHDQPITFQTNMRQLGILVREFGNIKFNPRKSVTAEEPKKPCDPELMNKLRANSTLGGSVFK